MVVIKDVLLYFALLVYQRQNWLNCTLWIDYGQLMGLTCHPSSGCLGLEGGSYHKQKRESSNDNIHWTGKNIALSKGFQIFAYSCH